MHNQNLCNYRPSQIFSKLTLMQSKQNSQSRNGSQVNVSHENGQHNMVFVTMSHAMQKCHKCCFLEYKGGWLELVFGGSFANYILCIYKLLIACASDNEERSPFISWMFCSSLLLQTLLIAIQKSHSWYEKYFFFRIWTYTRDAHTKLVPNAILSKWSAVHKTGN